MPQRLDPAKKTLITTAARSRFYTYGIQKTTMQEIATDCGLAVGTLYLYFKNKDEILLACVAEYEQQHRREVKAILASKAGTDKKILRYIHDRYEASRQTREGTDHAAEITRAVLRLCPQRLQEESTLMIETIAQLLTEGVEKQLFMIEDIPEAVEVFLYSIAYFFPLAGKEPEPLPNKQALTKVVRWFIRQWSP